MEEGQKIRNVKNGGGVENKEILKMEEWGGQKIKKY